jgi:hypothetical protein
VGCRTKEGPPMMKVYVVISIPFSNFTLKSSMKKGEVNRI